MKDARIGMIENGGGVIGFDEAACAVTIPHERSCHQPGAAVAVPPRRQAGEQATMFFLDPSGNAIEVKAFADIGQLFAR